MLSEEENKELEELKSLLYRNSITQYGKRKLINLYENLIEKQQKVANLQEKTIQLMAEQFEIMKDKEEEIDCFIPREYSDIDDCVKKDSCQECIIEYFRNKAKEK